jgi:opacity protein-like surface antigen
MKRLTAATLVGAVAVLVTASQARAQYVFLGGGANIPVSDFKETNKTGWIATGGIGLDIGDKGLWVEAEGWYGSNKAKSSTVGAKVDLWSALAAVGYTFMPAKSASPYVLGGVGVLGVKHGDTKFAYSGALGLSFKAGTSLHIFVEGRWLATEHAKMIPLTAGVSIQLGKKSM